MKLLSLHVMWRSIVLWLVFMLVMWAVFAIGWLAHPQAWNTGATIHPATGWQVFWFALAHNLLLLALIAAGNLFVRFGSITPGLLILFYQALAIGWLAGSNGFMEPFSSVEAANAAFLRVGLWETTAYVLVCAVTLPKSLLIADGFPARKWTDVRQIRDLRFDRAEILLGGAGLLCLLFAAASEAFLLGT